MSLQFLIVHYSLFVIPYCVTPNTPITPGGVQLATPIKPTVFSPAQVEGWHVTVLTASERKLPLPQVLLGVTVMLPAAVPAVTVMLLVFPPAVCDQPEGRDHV